MSSLRERQQVAERFLGERVELEATVALPQGAIEGWRGADCRPARLVPLFVGGDAFFRTDESWESFGRALKAGCVSLDDTDLLARLMAAAPGHRSAVREEYRVPPPFAATDWAPHRRADGTWVAHLIEHLEGRWERIEIGPDYDVVVTYLGEARAFSFR